MADLALDSQKCPNGHPCDNDGHCRVAGCAYAKPTALTHEAVPHG